MVTLYSIEQLCHGPHGEPRWETDPMYRYFTTRAACDMIVRELRQHQPKVQRRVAPVEVDK